MIINSANELKVYKAAYELAMAIFGISKTWPPEERYSLTDQIIRTMQISRKNDRFDAEKSRIIYTKTLSTDLRSLTSDL